MRLAATRSSISFGSAGPALAGAACARAPRSQPKEVSTAAPPASTSRRLGYSMRVPPYRWSLSQGAAEQSPDQIALQHDHQHHGRHAGQHRGRGDVAPWHLEDAREEGEGHRHRAARLGRRESVGEEELVPRKEKGEEGSRGEPRREEGENDPAEGARPARAVDGGGLLELGG